MFGLFIESKQTGRSVCEIKKDHGNNKKWQENDSESDLH